MKRVILLLTILLGVITEVDAQAKKPVDRQTGKTSKTIFLGEKAAQEDWQDFRNVEFSLTTSFPKKPDVSSRSDVELTEQGPVPIEITTIETYLNTTYYLVNVRSYPVGFLGKRTDLAANFGAWLEAGILRGVPILGARAIPFDKYLMLEFLYRPSVGELVVHRFVVIGDRLYQVLVQFPMDPKVSPEKAVETKAAQIKHFFDSFHVTVAQSGPNRSAE